MMCEASAGFPRRCSDVAAAALADVEVNVILYGVDCEAAALELHGAVKTMSAVREAGKSLRRTRVISTWCGAVCTVVLVGDVGSRLRDHASPFLKRGALGAIPPVESRLDAVLFNSSPSSSFVLCRA